MVSFNRLFAKSKRPILIAVIAVVTFAGVAIQDTVSINRNLHKQEQTIQHLDKTNTELNGTLKDKTDLKQQKQIEVETLEQQNQEIENERKSLESQV